MFLRRLRSRNKALWQITDRFSFFKVACGIRAKEENSSTILPISSTCRMIVSVQSENVSESSVICLMYLRFKRSAESCIGVIRCSLSQVLTDNPPLVSIAVHDNGAGLPEAGRENLTEPYVTRREGGTGLGLAIVKKIMEDHSGKIVLSNNEDGGATINLLFYQTDDREKIEPEL